MRTIVVGLLVLTALAGCSEDAQKEDAADDFGLDEDLEATSDTGVIRGVVVDDSITPIAGATVAIVGTELSTESNEDGAFGFGDLNPGTYFLEVSRLGFFSTQASAQVEAGVDSPPVVKVQLPRDLSFNPYSSTIQYSGFYQCGTSVVVVCAAPAILFDIFFGEADPIGIDSSTPTLPVGENATFVQTEMVWETTQTLSPALAFQMEALDSDCPETPSDFLLNETAGPSPLKATADEENLKAHFIGGEGCGIYYSVFSGDALDGAAIVPVGFSVEQPFDWFITEFHGYTPPSDWWYIYEGSLPPPS